MVKEKKQRTITRSQYHVLVGLRALAARLSAQAAELELAAAEIVGQKDEGHGYFGHVTDMLYGEGGEKDVTDMLKLLNVKIK